MNINTNAVNSVLPINQLKLFGYKNYFDSFLKMYQKNTLPNVILLSGPKGLGKATFAYHFINYLLSINELNKYSLETNLINSDNKSYKNLCNFTHSNFFLIEKKNTDENIKIDKIRDVLKFLNYSTYSSNIKIILIDGVEYLNINSSNALLKVLEEPNPNTFFFLIHNNNRKILNTVKSRCIEFKIFFNLTEKREILESIINYYYKDLKIKKVEHSLFSDTPGIILKYLILFNDSNINSLNDKITCISLLIDKYKKNPDQELLSFISSLIELFYNDLALKNIENSNQYHFNKFKILKKIDDSKKYNLDKNNLFITLQDMLENEL